MAGRDLTTEQYDRWSWLTKEKWEEYSLTELIAFIKFDDFFHELTVEYQQEKNKKINA